MSKWLTRTTVFLVCLAAATPARAQYLAAPAAASPVVEPLPYAVSQPPPCAPAPGPGPQGDSPLALPADLPNGFLDPRKGEECYAQCPGCYLNIGIISYGRQRLPKIPVAYNDDTGFDDGTPIPGDAGVTSTLRKVKPQLTPGMRLTVGYQWGDEALELVGWFIPDSGASHTRIDQGLIDVPFFNAPAGFAGVNGLFQAADFVRIEYQSSLANAEANARYQAEFAPSFEWIIGARYLDQRERLSIITGDDVLFPPGLVAASVASYNVHTHNRIFGGQFGFECDQMVCSCVSVGMMNKNLIGANWLTSATRLRREDGLLGPRGERESTAVAGAIDLNFYVDLYFMERGRLRAGYNLLEIMGVAKASNQIDFNLANPGGRVSNHGSVLYQGPMLEFQFLF